MALATDTTPGSIHLGGDLNGSNNALEPELTPTGVQSGIYNFPNLVIDSKGRILSISEANIDDVPCSTPSSCGLVSIGNNLTVDGTGLVDYTTDGSLTDKGVVQAGSGFNLNSGVISVDTSSLFVQATTSTLGTIIVGNTLSIDGTGNLSINPATNSVIGGVFVDISNNNLSINSNILEFSGNDFPLATSTTKGIVQPGTNIYIDTGGISLIDAQTYSKGVVSISEGNGLTVSSGILAYVPPPITVDPATTTVLGGVIVPTSGNLDIDGSGNISIPSSSNTTLGVIKPGISNTLTIYGGGDLDTGTNVAVTDVHNTWSNRQISTMFTLNSTTTTTLDLLNSNSFELTLVGNTTMAIPTNQQDGLNFTVITKQDATGGRSVTFNSIFTFYEPPVVTQPANSVDVMQCVCLSSKIYCTYITNYS